MTSLDELKQALIENFEITVTKYHYIPNGHKQFFPTEQILGDSIDFAWLVRHKHSENSRTFMVAYAVEDPTLTPQEHTKLAWKLRETEVLDWVSSLMKQKTESIVGQTFNPFA